jgi:serine/threonine-protein kinase HipA
MRKAKVYNFGKYAGDLIELEKTKNYKFVYDNNYNGAAISLTMPVAKKEYDFNSFPPFFEGLLPEGMQLEALLRQTKTDKDDLFTQLVLVGKDLVGSVTVEEVK